ncbi:MAG: cytochrome c [Anaerolinea sp.]|nr:cytochrome c [Anaerolinea sp.]
MNSSTTPQRSWALIIVMSIIIVITAAFLFMMFNWQPPRADSVVDREEDLAAAVNVLLARGNPANGETLTVTYGCAACHVTGVAHGLAPAFTGVADVAAMRNPPLSAAEYLYQSIVHPTAYLVEGYANSMPQDFASRMSEQDLADVLAYLLEQRTDVSEAVPTSGGTTGSQAGG